MASVVGRVAIVAFAVLVVAAQIWWVYYLIRIEARLDGCVGDGCSYAQIGYVVWAVIEVLFLAFWFGVYVVIRRVQAGHSAKRETAHR